MSLKDWLYPKSMFMPTGENTHSILRTQIRVAMSTIFFNGPKSPTEKKVLKAIEKLNVKMLDVAEKNPKFNNETYNLLWNENYLHVFSSKYKHRVHNTAANFFQERVLSPLKEKVKS